jgi:hypothetical protein
MLSGKLKEEKYFKKKQLQVGKATVKCQLEEDALKIINSRLGTRYRSLKQVSLEEIIKLPTISS